MSDSVYQGIYNLIQTYIFGGSVASGSFQEMFCVLFAGAACAFVMILPFILVYHFISLFFWR